MNSVYTLNRRILVIDDNQNILQDFRKILCPVGSFISHARSECGYDLFDEPFPHRGKEPFDLDCVDNGMINIEYIPSEENPADILTHPVGQEKLEKHISTLLKWHLLSKI